MYPPSDDLRLGPVALPETPEALRLIFGRLPAEQRESQIEALLAEAKSDAAPLTQGLLAAYRKERLVGAVLAQRLPGKTAMLWPPRTVPGESPDTADLLLQAACNRLAELDVCLVQTLLPSDTSPDVTLLQSGGFTRLAKLFYLVSQEDAFPTSPPPGPLTFEPYDPENHERLATLVEATYAQTLDCPAINDVRQIDDVLEGYRAAGSFDPRCWLIARHASRDVGCLLLTDHPENGNLELVYMGLVVSARGKEWGLGITRQAQWIARQIGRPRLVLAVDAANRPALTMYSLAGFQAWDRRVVYVKVLHPPDMGQTAWGE